MFLQLRSFKVREILANGLQETLSGTGCLDDETLQLVKDMNKVKRGLADMELDYDKTLAAITSVRTMEIEVSPENMLKIEALSFNILYLLTNKEYAVRDYAQFAL